MEVKDKDELTEVTKTLLLRTSVMKENVKKSMVVGEFNILRGIMIFEVTLKEINPMVINSNIISEVANLVSLYLRNKEDENQKVNNYVHYGINQCLMMMDSYNKTLKRKK